MEARKDRYWNLQNVRSAGKMERVLFYANSAKHLAGNINIRKGKFVIKRFSDGEIYIKINEEVSNKNIWVVGSISTDGFLELILLLDALKRASAGINLIIPYFGYARQDRFAKGECFSVKVICD